MKKFAVLFTVLFLYSSSAAFAINDVTITDITNFNLNTADTAAPTTITASAGGSVTNLYVETDYIDITIDNLSTITFNTTVAGNYLKVAKVSGSNDYTVAPTCPTTTATITGTGAQAVLRLQVYTTSQCPVTPPSSGGGGGGGGGAILPLEEPPQTTEPTTEPSCDRTATTPVPFTDIIGHWGESYIETLYRRCIVDGKSTYIFGPNDNTTRAELVKIILNTYDMGTAPWQNLYPDVLWEDWFAEYVTQASLLGIVEGYVQEDGINIFKPNQPITRAEALKVTLKTKGITDFGGYTSKFVDINEGDWYYDYIAYAEAHDIVEGYTETFNNDGLVLQLYSIPRNLVLGDTGQDVYNLKEVMKQLGYFTGETTDVYDQPLADAITQYQIDHDLLPVGSMGPITRSLIINETLVPVTIVLYKPNNYVTRAETSKIDLRVEAL